MTILVLGNGFDLAHGLPTTYKNFLDFMCAVKKIGRHKDEASKIKCITRYTDKLCDALIASSSYHYDIMEQCINNYRNKLKETMIKNFCNSKENMDIQQDNRFLLENAKDNTWIEYFIQVPMYEKDNWIDFESEISHVIQSVDNDMVGELEKNVMTLTNEFLRLRFTNDTTNLEISLEHNENILSCKRILTFRELINKLYEDMNRLTRCLEIYLTEYIEKLEITVTSPDVEGIKPNKVLSFNYTDTYHKLYELERLKKSNLEYGILEYDYIHGNADLNNTIRSNNMVLGIDEYLPDQRKNKDIEFIAFKKFYQRIRKKTGSKYRNWVGTIRKRYELDLERNNREDQSMLGYQVHVPTFFEQHYLYIFGHSLDLTDGDILRDLLLNDCVHTIIYYLDEEVFGRQIANLVKVIGQEELIKRTGGPTKTITFKQQQPMKKKQS